MTPEGKILRYLNAGQATTSSIGEALSIHPEVVEKILRRMEIDRLVASKLLASTSLKVWQNFPSSHESI